MTTARPSTRREGVVPHEARLHLAQSLGAAPHAHGETGDRAVDHLGFDDVVAELGRLGQRPTDGRVIDVVPVPDVFEERRLVARGLRDVAPDRERRQQAEECRGDVHQREPVLGHGVGVAPGRDVAEGRREEAGQGVVVDPRQVEYAADHGERGEHDERRRHDPRRLVRVVSAGCPRGSARCRGT